MSARNPAAVMQRAAATRHRTHRLVRQLHLSIGAWGAIAAILYGTTGLVLNHRASWPQGQTGEIGRETLQIPAEARETPEQLSLWLRQTRGLDATTIRRGGAGASAGADRPEAASAERGAAQRWTLSGGNASHPWALAYSPGSGSAELKRSERSLLASFNMLHKAVGGSWLWVALADSFAIGMVLLGISGIVLWQRGRSAKQMLLSVMSVATLLVLLIGGAALF